MKGAPAVTRLGLVIIRTDEAKAEVFAAPAWEAFTSAENVQAMTKIGGFLGEG